MTDHVSNTSSDLAGLHTAIALKADLLYRVATSHPSRWRKHVARFVIALERSPLRDSTALVVLLTELCEQLRLLSSVRPLSSETGVSAGRVFPLEAWTRLPRREILTRFKEEIVDVLLYAAPHVSLSPFVQRAKRLIEERYAAPLTLDRLAVAVGRSKRQLASVFQQELAMTAHEYLTRVRLRRALELIRDGEKIEAVSLLVGYHSKKNFYRHFKMRIGVTPLAYKALLLRTDRPL